MSERMKVIKKWSFNDSLEGFEGFTHFGPLDGSREIETSLDQQSHDGSNALRVFADASGDQWTDPFQNNIGWRILRGFASKSFDVPLASKYGLEWWMLAPPQEGRVTGAGILVLDSTGNGGICYLSHEYAYTSHLTGNFEGAALACSTGHGVCLLPDEPEWLHCYVEWDVASAAIDYYVYNSAGVLLGSYQTGGGSYYRVHSKCDFTGSGFGGFVPAIANRVKPADGSLTGIPGEIRCGVRANVRAYAVMYDDITLYAQDPIYPIYPTSRRRRAAWMDLERPSIL